MSDKTRVLLKQGKEIKKFFFITPNNEGSIFFGSSFKPNEMKIGIIQIPSDPNNGKSKIDFKAGKDIEPHVSKFSYHPPLKQHPNSIIHLKTDEKDSKKVIFEYKVSQLERMESYRKLFIIVPKNPINFPNFTKAKSQNDIVIPIDSFNNTPFCVDVYLCKKNYRYKQLFSSGEISIAGVCENKDYILFIKLYHKNSFTNWPQYTSVIPYIDNVDIEINSIP